MTGQAKKGSADSVIQKRIAARAGAGLLALALCTMLFLTTVVVWPLLQKTNEFTPSVHSATEIGELRLPQGEIPINSADAATLQTLPGIGEKLSQAIVEERINGVYLLPQDLLRVNGIGRKKVEAIRALINMD